MKAKAKTYTDSQFYTGRAVTIKRGDKEVVGKVGTGTQCGSSMFSFASPPTDSSYPYWDDSCEYRTAIVKLGK